MKCVVCQHPLPIEKVQESSNFDCPHCGSHYEHTCEQAFMPNEKQLQAMRNPGEIVRWKTVAFELFEKLSKLGHSRDFTRDQEKAYVQLLEERNAAVDKRVDTIISGLHPADAKFLQEYVDNLRANVTG